MTPRPLDFESSAISQIIYDDETEITVVTFKDGETYGYMLPQDVIDAWMASGSIGGFYNAEIRQQFSFAHHGANRGRFGD